MKRYTRQWIEDWCAEHGWTDLFLERYFYWAFPPGAVMPQPIPLNALRAIKQKKGLSPVERVCYGVAGGGTFLAGLFTYGSGCPLPLILAFCVAALAIAYLDDEVPSCS